MAETIHSGGETKRASRRGNPAGRLTLLLLTLLAALACAGWIKSLAWQRMEQLRDEFAAIESERFLLGLHARETIMGLNAALLRFQLSGAAEARQEFSRRAQELSTRLDRFETRRVSMRERQHVQALAAEYRGYLAGTDAMIESSPRGIRRDTAATVHGRIEQESAGVLRAAEALVQAQREAWQAFLGEASEALAGLQRLVWTSTAALVALIALVCGLMFRLWIAPLRRRLRDTEALAARKEAEASLGVLAAGVAHEIRNPLQAIKMRLFSFKRSLPANRREDEDLGVIASEIQRLERIVKDTLDFARPAPPQLVAADAQSLLEEAQRLLDASIRARGLRLELEPGDPLPVRVDRQQMQQVLINLVQNAADASPSGAAIVLRGRLGVTTLAGKTRPSAILEVTDHGSGVSPEAEGRLFDPFFSTREAGTGLGLSIAARIVEMHGGVIQYSTRLKRGTTFSIVLPRATDHESASAAH